MATKRKMDFDEGTDNKKVCLTKQKSTKIYNKKVEPKQNIEIIIEEIPVFENTEQYGRVHRSDCWCSRCIDERLIDENIDLDNMNI